MCECAVNNSVWIKIISYICLVISVTFCFPLIRKLSKV